MDPILRKLARDQWVRFHGTPRITVLVGAARARSMWARWAQLAAPDGTLLDGPFEACIRDAVSRATAEAARAIAVIVRADELARWRKDRSDRLAALVDEGVLEIPELAAPESAELLLDARSAAEAALYEALEATPATVGRFRLNESLSVRFGPRAAEIDLLSREDRIAIEIDGFHHFGDLECYRRDRRKDLLMQMQGLLVIRLLAEDVLRDARDAVNVVCQALAYRQGGR